MCKTDHDKKNIDNKNIGFWEQKKSSARECLFFSVLQRVTFEKKRKDSLKINNFRNMKLDTFLATQRKNTGSTGKERWKLQ